MKILPRKFKIWFNIISLGWLHELLHIALEKVSLTPLSFVELISHLYSHTLKKKCGVEIFEQKTTYLKLFTILSSLTILLTAYKLRIAIFKKLTIEISLDKSLRLLIPLLQITLLSLINNFLPVLIDSYQNTILLA